MRNSNTPSAESASPPPRLSRAPGTHCPNPDQLRFGSNDAELDGSAYPGIEMLVYGRTADCGWYDESYRYTFFAKPEWQLVRIPWADFKPNGVKAALNSSRINRIAILGWMREFQADIALARIGLYA